MNSSQTETTGQSHTVEPRLLPSRRTTGKIGGRPEALGDCWSGAVAVGSGSGDRWPHRRSMESLPVDAVYDASSALPCCYKSPDTVDPVRRADDELNADRIAHSCTRCRGLGVGGRCVRILGQVERQRRLPAQRGAVHAFAGVSHFPDASPGRPPRHPQLDQAARPRVPIRSEGVRQVPGWRRKPTGGHGQREGRPAQPREMHTRPRPGELFRPDDFASTSPAAW